MYRHPILLQDRRDDRRRDDRRGGGGRDRDRDRGGRRRRSRSRSRSRERRRRRPPTKFDIKPPGFEDSPLASLSQQQLAELFKMNPSLALQLGAHNMGMPTGGPGGGTFVLLLFYYK